jgi:hypothetical protein
MSNSTRWPDCHVRQVRLSVFLVPTWNEIADASVLDVLTRIHQPVFVACAFAGEAPTLRDAPKRAIANNEPAYCLIFIDVFGFSVLAI